MLNLPTEFIKAKRINPRIMLLYGMPKVGKTSILSKLENNLIIDLEDGTDFIDALKISVHALSELEIVGNKILEAGRPYKYVSIDTVSKLESWSEEKAKELYLNSSIAKREYKQNPNLLQSVLALPEGAGYLWLRIAYGMAFDYCCKLAENVIFVAHVRDKQLVDKNGREVGSNDLSLTGKIKQITCGKADAIGYIYREVMGAEAGKPVSLLKVNFNSNSEILCGSRCEHLKGADIEFKWENIFLKENK